MYKVSVKQSKHNYIWYLWWVAISNYPHPNPHPDPSHSQKHFHTPNTNATSTPGTQQSQEKSYTRIQCASHAEDNNSVSLYMWCTCKNSDTALRLVKKPSKKLRPSPTFYYTVQFFLQPNWSNTLVTYSEQCPRTTAYSAHNEPRDNLPAS